MQSNLKTQTQGFFAFQDVGTLISSLINALIIIAALAALIYFILGGLQWITSGGDKAKVEQAQKQITNGLTGLIIVVASYAVFVLIKNFLGLDQALPTS